MELSGGGELGICPFCRELAANSDEEDNKRIKKLMEAGNAHAYYTYGCFFSQGLYGFPRDRAKARELWLRAGDLGCADAHYNLGSAFDNGRGVAIDQKKAKDFFGLAAMNGSVSARHNLGCIEGRAGNHHRAFKHYLIAARAGHEESLDNIRNGFRIGVATKDEYESALRAYQKRQDEMKSDIRDKAEAFRRNEATT